MKLQATGFCQSQFKVKFGTWRVLITGPAVNNSWLCDGNDTDCVPKFKLTLLRLNPNVLHKQQQY